MICDLIPLYFQERNIIALNPILVTEYPQSTRHKQVKARAPSDRSEPKLPRPYQQAR